MKKILSPILIAGASLTFANTALADGVIAITFGDKIAVVKAHNNNFKMVDEAFGTRNYVGTPKTPEYGFFGNISEHKYEFYKDRLNSATLVLKEYKDVSQAAFKSTVADYEAKKAEMIKILGVQPVSYEVTYPGVSYMACLDDEANCGSYTSYFFAGGKAYQLYIGPSPIAEGLGVLAITMEKSRPLPQS